MAVTQGTVAPRPVGNEAELIRTFGDFEFWPVDAQLGVLSMAWTPAVVQSATVV